MIVNKAFKYRLKPTNLQKQHLSQHAGNARFIYNYLLAQNINKYKTEKKFIFSHEMITEIPKIKEEQEFLKLSFSQSLQTVGRQLDRALKDSFKTKKGFPKFKKKSLERDSFHCPQKWKLSKGFVRIPKIGKVLWCKHRNLEGKPKSITITQEGRRWFCSVLCEVEIKEKAKKTKNIVGIDVGLKELATLSDKTVIKRIRFTKNFENKLSREQRKLSKKVKGSKNRYKQRRKVQDIHYKIRNARKDFLNKVTHDMITKYDGFCLEDLNVKGMLKNKKLSKSISDVSWSEFKRQLEYKSLWDSKHFIEIDRWFASTKTCSSCGLKREMSLKDREFVCECGFSLDRDLNASVNILVEGLRSLLKDEEENTLGQREINVCGDDNVHGFSNEKSGDRRGSRKKKLSIS